MPTISTHTLSADLPREVLAIAVDPLTVDPDKDGKSGYWKLVINSITWTGSELSSDKTFLLDIRAGIFHELNDEPLVASQSLASDALSATPDKTTHVLAMTKGNVGPSAKPQPDGTFDVVNISVDLGTISVSNFVLTVDYTLTFTEINDTTLASLTAGSVDFDVNNDQPGDFATVLVTPSTGYGVYVIAAQTLESSLLIDSALSKFEPAPILRVVTVPTVGGYGLEYVLLNHFTSKTPVHTKEYPADTVLVLALNNGKIDANGTAVKVSKDGVVSTYHLLSNMSLYRPDYWPSGDDVSAVLNYKYGFLSA